MPPKRRPASSRSTGTKRARKASAVGNPSTGSTSIKAEQRPDEATSSVVPSSAAGTAASASSAAAAPVATPVDLEGEKLRARFMGFLQQHADGVSNTLLKREFKQENEYKRLVPIINELTVSSRLQMSKSVQTNELIYTLISEDEATKLHGLDVSAKMVYQLIEKAGNTGVWTKEIRNRTHIQQQALNKIFKALEGRKLIKPVKSVSSKKVYMLYHLQPAKELTGGPWYTELEFDHEFIHEMRKFFLNCIRRASNPAAHKGGGPVGISLADLQTTLAQANVSKVALTLEEVQQLMQTLVYDNLIESHSVNTHDEELFVATRRVTSMCDFQWWDAALSPDFHFRKIVFEDGVELMPHEPHHHTE